MSRGERLALILGILVGLGFLLAGISESRREEHECPAPSGFDLAAHLDLDLSDPDEARGDICHPDEMTSVLRTPHVLYRRPIRSRPGHEQLCERGWQAWYLDPPSEDTRP